MNNKKEKIKMINDLLLGRYKPEEDLNSTMERTFFSLKRRDGRTSEEEAEAYEKANPGKKAIVIKLKRRGED